MRSDEKMCPQCAEVIKLEARVCRHCDHQFSEEDVVAARKGKSKMGVILGISGAVASSVGNFDLAKFRPPVRPLA